MKQRIRARIQQLWYPDEFRLHEPEFTSEQIELLEELVQLIQPSLLQTEAGHQDERVRMAHFLVDVGTGIWRIRRKIESLKRMPKELKEALYSLESTWNSMAEGGVEIIDHIGEVPRGKYPKVVEVREMPELDREQIVEAIKPTIILRGEVVQIGEVILGRPAAAPAAEVEQGG